MYFFLCAISKLKIKYHCFCRINSSSLNSDSNAEAGTKERRATGIKNVKKKKTIDCNFTNEITEKKVKKLHKKVKKKKSLF